MNHAIPYPSVPASGHPHLPGDRHESSAKRAASSPFRRVFSGVMLALTLSLPSGVQADDRVEAAMAIVVPPDRSDVERLIETLAISSDAEDKRALREQLLRLYESDEFRQRTARVYAKYLSADELRYLAETLQHPVFRRYREIAPAIMLELAALERDLFARFEP
jgi:hypothetical protein